MKKTVILLAILLAASCSKNYDAFSGSGRSTSETGRMYMIGIVNDVVVDNLQQLESALFISERGADALSFNTGGKKLTDEGAVWTLTREGSVFNGLKITRTGENSWEMERSGEYPILGVIYPTSYKISVVRGSSKNASHYDWDVSLNGKRTEKEGYACAFSSDGVLSFTYEKGNTADWNSCKGYLMMSVTKNNKAVDEACLVLDGGESEAAFRRLL